MFSAEILHHLSPDSRCAAAVRQLLPLSPPSHFHARLFFFQPPPRKKKKSPLPLAPSPQPSSSSSTSSPTTAELCHYPRPHPSIFGRSSRPPANPLISSHLCLEHAFSATMHACASCVRTRLTFATHRAVLFLPPVS